MPSGENFIVDMQVDALTKAGHKVRVIAKRTDENAKDRFFPVRTAIHVATGGGPSPLEEIQLFNPDIIHVHNLFPNFSTNWLDKWKGPIIATLHNFRPMCSNGLLFREGQPCYLCPNHGQHHAVIHKCYRNSRFATIPVALSNRKGLIENPVISRATRLIALSDRSRETYIAHGVDSDKIQVIPNFIGEIVAPSNVETRNNEWLYAGRLTTEKGITELIRQWPSNEKLAVAGNGPESDSIEELARNRDNITYLGPLKRSQLLKRLAYARGLIIPSLCAENLPTVYLEALSAGRPVIARKGNSAADDVSLWAPPLTYTTTPELMRALNYTRSKYYELEELARKRYHLKYTEKAWTASVGDIYKEAQRIYEHN